MRALARCSRDLTASGLEESVRQEGDMEIWTGQALEKKA